MREAGLRGFWSGYFAARAAPLGRVGPGPVAAAFYNFHPGMVARAVPGCWDVVAPETLCRVRAIAAADALFEGFLGYSLPDDLVSGTGLRIMFSIVLSIPIVRSYLATFLFGGNFPGNGIIIPRLFIIHVLIVPLIIFGLLGAHLGLLVRQKHTQFPGHGRTEKNVVGSPMYPTFIAKTTGFLFG